MKKPLVFLVITSTLLIGLVTFLLFTNQTNDIAKKATEEKKIIVPAETPGTHGNFAENATPEDFFIAGFGLSSSGENVLKALGEPEKKTSEVEQSFQNPDYKISWETWTYPNMEIIFATSVPKDQTFPALPKEVFRVEISRGEYPTKRGVKLGDPLEMVLRQYGSVQPDPETARYIYSQNLNNIGFTITQGKVAKIELWWEFD